MLKLGMIGGGQGAFIGAVHRMAAALDGEFVFVAGALSSTPDRSIASGRALGLVPDRCYPTWRDMLRAEQVRPANDRVDVVAIVTPNAAHFDIALAFVQAGFHVACDKPMTVTSDQAAALVAAVDKAGVVFAVTYNYTGYPMVRQAAAMVRSGQIGAVRKVCVEYHQGWLAGPLEATGQKQAAWRQDPALAGAGGAIADIGTHAENLVSTVTGLEIESMCADLTVFVPGRKFDDDASVLLRFRGGARGVLTASQVCIGEHNNLTLRVYGDQGSLAWRQEEPNALIWHRSDGATRVMTRGAADLSPAAITATRIPPGHPEGFIEAFANVYRGVAGMVNARREGRAPSDLGLGLPTVRDGERGVRFVQAVVSSQGRWVPMGQ